VNFQRSTVISIMQLTLKIYNQRIPQRSSSEYNERWQVRVYSEQVFKVRHCATIRSAHPQRGVLASEVTRANQEPLVVTDEDGRPQEDLMVTHCFCVYIAVVSVGTNSQVTYLNRIVK